MTPSAVPSDSSEETVFLWVTYKPEEVNEGYWAVYRELVLPRILLSIFCIAFTLGFGTIFERFNDFDPVAALILMALSIFVFPPLLCLYVYLVLRGRRMSSYDNRPNFHFPMMYTLSDLGCQIQYASGAGLLDWRHFSLALESPTAFCLASSVDDVFVLPKRCLGGQEELEKTRALIKAKVRVYRHVGFGSRKVEIAFEKAAIQAVVDQGIEEVVRLAEEAEAREKEGQAGASEKSEPAKEEDVVQLPEPAQAVDVLQFTSPLKSGLAVEIAYQAGEILSAENIYFFRKRIGSLVTFYIAMLIYLLLVATALSYCWGLQQSILGALQPWVICIIPVFFLHAGILYLVVRRRTLLSEKYATPIVFQFTEEGCGVRAGERYAVLAWWHFRECWETEEQFLILVGQRGHAMYVIPKRVFPDQAGLRYIKQLLQRKVTRYKDVSG